MYASSDSQGIFDITVPIIDSETGISGPAKLRCSVSPKGHSVDLLEWREFDQHHPRSVESLQQRVTATLTFVAERQVCGNRNICPSEVVRIVEKNGTS